MNNDPTIKIPRRQQILECLAQMLEESPGARITTAALAKKVGVSEAALYRHFPSKTKMFEGLIEFIEETIFTRIKIITQDRQDSQTQCEKILFLLLTFTERNPGITRLLTGDALAGRSLSRYCERQKYASQEEQRLIQVLPLIFCCRWQRGELRSTSEANLNANLPSIGRINGLC
jgi:TetR/AcrR family transcriptional regulator